MRYGRTVNMRPAVIKANERLLNLGVECSIKPIEMETVKIAAFNDNCGKNIQIVEVL